MNRKDYEQWQAEIKKAKEELLKKDVLLSQYALWLKTSEENTTYKGEDIYHMLLGVLQGISGVYFFPGINNQNFALVVSEVQKETGLDLGVCRFLEDNVRELERYSYTGERTGETFPICHAKEGLMIGSLSCCIPPRRIQCEQRIAKLEQIAIKD